MAQMECEAEEDVDMGGMFGGDDDDSGEEMSMSRSAAPRRGMQMKKAAMAPPMQAMQM